MITIVLDTGDYELYLFVWRPFLLSSTSKQMDYLFHWEIQNFGSCFKKEVNEERNREKKSKPKFLNKKQETFEIFDLKFIWFNIYLCMILFFLFFFHGTEFTLPLNKYIIFSFQTLFDKCEITFTFPCRVVTKRHLHSNKLAVFCLSILTFCYHPAWKG